MDYPDYDEVVTAPLLIPDSQSADSTTSDYYFNFSNGGGSSTSTYPRLTGFSESLQKPGGG
jgi:hypothetical protein